MYICSTSKMLHTNKTTNEYKKMLKDISNQSFRRISKFNAMAIYGALQCIQNTNYDQNLNIYTASEYGCIQDMNKVLEQVSKKDEILMPFDFLNVNGNNVGFLVSQALNTLGNNFYITAEDFSFEKAFELAYFDLSVNKIEEAIVGAVDESVEKLDNHNAFIHNIFQKPSYDASIWFYLSKKAQNSIAKIEAIQSFETLKEIEQFIRDTRIEHIATNNFATLYKNELNIDTSLFIDQNNELFFGTQSALFLDELLKYNGRLALLSLDEKKRSNIIYITK